jgi:hypothetical protein
MAVPLFSTLTDKLYHMPAGDGRFLFEKFEGNRKAELFWGLSISEVYFYNAIKKYLRRGTFINR